MASFSPTAEGFRAIFRQPAIPLAEIAWRWSFAAAAWFLGMMFLFEYADTLPVSRVERLMLGSQQPALVWRAIHRIFEGSALRFINAGALLALALVIAWIVVASIGRSVTVRSLIEQHGIVDGNAWSSRAAIRSLLSIHFFRAAVSLAAVAAGVGTLLLASSMWASTRASAADAMRFWFALLFLTWIAWSALNWLLSTSAVFALDRNEDVFGAIASVVDFCVQRPGALVAPGTWFGLAHFGAFLFACGAGFTVLGAAEVIGGRPTLFLEFLIVLVYCAVVDFLHVGRLAAYIAVIRGDAGPSNEAAPLNTLPNQSAAVDRSELILSDVPHPAS